MSRNDGISRIPIHVPPMYDPVWMQQFIKLLFDTDMKSGISGPSATTGNGWFIGYDENRDPKIVFGDLDNDRYIKILNGIIQSSQFQVYDGAGTHPVGYGFEVGEASDGDAVTFSVPFSDPPTVLFVSGGLTYEHSTLGSAASQYQDFRAQDLTETGFTAFLKLSGLPSGASVQTDTFTGGSTSGVGSSDSVAKGTATEAYDDNYTFQYDVTLVAAGGSPGEPVPQYITLKLYTNDGGGDVLRATKIYSNSDTTSSKTYSNQTVTVNVDGLGSGSSFKIEISASTSASNSFNGDNVTYDTGSSATTVDATSSGSAPVKWIAIGT